MAISSHLLLLIPLTSTWSMWVRDVCWFYTQTGGSTSGRRGIMVGGITHSSTDPTFEYRQSLFQSQYYSTEEANINGKTSLSRPKKVMVQSWCYLIYSQRTFVQHTTCFPFHSSNATQSKKRCYKAQVQSQGCFQASFLINIY